MIHRPFSRIHIVMYLFSGALALATTFVIVAFLTRSTDTGWALVGGVALLLAFFGICGAAIWVTYLAYQLTVELRDGRLAVRSWLKIGPLGTDRTIEVGRARQARIFRPYFVEFEIPGATTRVWSMYQLLGDRDRFGTMWWFEDDYRALQHLLGELDLTSGYRRTRDFIGLVGWVTSR